MSSFRRKCSVGDSIKLIDEFVFADDSPIKIKLNNYLCLNTDTIIFKFRKLNTEFGDNYVLSGDNWYNGFIFSTVADRNRGYIQCRRNTFVEFISLKDDKNLIHTYIIPNKYITNNVNLSIENNIQFSSTPPRLKWQSISSLEIKRNDKTIHYYQGAKYNGQIIVYDTITKDKFYPIDGTLEEYVHTNN